MPAIKREQFILYLWKQQTMYTQVNRMSKSHRVLAIRGKQRSFGLHIVCFEMVLYHNEPH